jgi:hypothetical protein
LERRAIRRTSLVSEILRRTTESGQRLTGWPEATSLEASMHGLKVIAISAEEAEQGVRNSGQAAADRLHLLDDGELKLRFVLRHDGSPVVVGLRSLSKALAEVERVLGG